jgi:hypothetical protein
MVKLAGLMIAVGSYFVYYHISRGVHIENKRYIKRGCGLIALGGLWIIIFA